MRRTILSENQYEPRFISAAKMNAMTIPFWPPSKSPIKSSMPRSRPSSSAVFNPLGMCLFCLAEVPQERADDRGAPRQILGFDVLVQRVGPIAARAESI